MNAMRRKLWLGAGLLVLPAAALAHTDVYVGVGLDGGYVAPPPPVYYAPPPVWYGPTVVYGDDDWRWRHRHHRDWDDDHWREREWHHHHHHRHGDDD